MDLTSPEPPQSSLSQACQRCWRRKQKCDKQFPVCGNCSQANAKCESRTWGAPGGLERNLDNPRSESFIQYLKDRIRYLESEDLTTQDGISPAMSQRNIARTTSISELPNRPISAPSEGRTYNDQVNDVGYLSLTAMSGVDVEGDAAMKSHFPASLTLELLTMNSLNPGASGPLMSNKRIPPSEDKILAVRDFASTLEDAQVTQVADSLSCWTMQGLRVSRDSNIQKHLDSLGDLETPESLYESVFMLAALAWTLPRLRPAESESLAVRLVDAVQSINSVIILNDPSINQLRCLIAQATLALYYPSASSSWHLIGLAATKAISRGLHHRSTEETENSRSAQDDVFWSIYILDRTLGLCFDRPFGIQEDDITIPLVRPLADITTIEEIRDSMTTMRILIIQYYQMVSSWRVQETTDDLRTRFSDYSYWRQTYSELITQFSHEDQSTNRFLRAFALKHESQLSVRGLFQLYADIKPDNHDQCVHDIKAQIPKEVETFISSVQEYSDIHKGLLGFVDAYDITVGIVCYICVKAETSRTWTLSITDFKMLMVFGDVLKEVARRFDTIHVLKDTVWNFLGAIEELDKFHNNFQQAENVIQHFTQGFSHLDLPVPDVLVKTMVQCLRYRC